MPRFSLNPNGQDAYTCPSIEVHNDSSEPTLVTDSTKIAEYLDAEYPDPPLFPGSTKGLQLALLEQIASSIPPALTRLAISLSFRQLNPESVDFFRATREARFGRNVEELCPAGPEREAAIEATKEVFHKLARYWSAEKGGLFLLGERISYADFFIAATVKWYKIVGEEEIWSHMKTWDDGLWEKIVIAMDEKYGQVL